MARCRHLGGWHAHRGPTTGQGCTLCRCTRTPVLGAAASAGGSSLASLIIADSPGAHQAAASEWFVLWQAEQGWWTRGPPTALAALQVLRSSTGVQQPAHRRREVARHGLTRLQKFCCSEVWHACLQFSFTGAACWQLVGTPKATRHRLTGCLQPLRGWGCPQCACPWRPSQALAGSAHPRSHHSPGLPCGPCASCCACRPCPTPARPGRPALVRPGCPPLGAAASSPLQALQEEPAQRQARLGQQGNIARCTGHCTRAIAPGQRAGTC